MNRDDAGNIGSALLRLEPLHHLDPADGDARRAVGELLDIALGDAARPPWRMVAEFRTSASSRRSASTPPAMARRLCRLEALASLPVR